jgi:hypothetical protein
MGSQISATAVQLGVQYITPAFWILLAFAMYAFAMVVTSILVFHTELGAWFSSEISQLSTGLRNAASPQITHPGKMLHRSGH